VSPLTYYFALVFYLAPAPDNGWLIFFGCCWWLASNHFKKIARRDLNSVALEP